MIGKRSLLSLSSIVLLIAFVYNKNFRSEPSPVVTTKDGMLQGIVSISRDGLEFYQYLGIPFAKPPIGERRFESPQPAEKWEGIREAGSYQSPCIQFDFIVTGFLAGSEDCLYLNVFVPKNIGNKPLPVMFHIHGGYFHLGATVVYGPDFFMDRVGSESGVVLVTTTYRLGALGFLSTGDDVVRGNMGLKDQNLALRWVQANIKAFGGDPSRVTIFGESAGGVSVHHHVLSSKSKGLFRKAIFQSGSALSYWGVHRNVKEQSQRFATKLDCQVDNSKDMVTCLKKLDARTLVGAHEDARTFFRTRLSTFAPSIEVIHDDDAFLTEEPLKLLKSGRFNKVPIIAGSASDEGLLVTAMMAANQTKLNEANDDWETWAPRVLHYEEKLKDVTSKLRKFYFGDEKNLINDTKYIQNFTNLLGDRLFTIAPTQSARFHSKYVPTYLYYFNYRTDFSLATVLANSQGSFHVVFEFLAHRLKTLYYRHVLNEELPHLGTCHADEMPILFSGRFFDQLIISRDRDYEMSRDMVKLWMDFARDEKILKFRNIEWPALTNDSMKFLKISNDPAVIDEPFEDRRKLWESLGILNY